MRRDDFGMRVDEVRELATKYSKQELSNMVRMGMIEPQKALMAGMMIDRIAKSAMQPPQTTVAEDVLPQQPIAAQGQIPPQGIMAAPHAPAASAGVAGLPSGIRTMAGGGIVAFADGDLVQEETPAISLADLKTGKVPYYSAPAPEKVDLAGAAQRREQAEKQAGLDPNLFAKMRDEETISKEDLAAQREQAKGAALMNFGLSLLGARKGQEWQTASAAGQQSLMQYGAAVKDIRAQEKDMKKTLRELSLAEHAYKKSNSEKDLASVQRYEEQLQAHQENLAKAQNRAVEFGTQAAVNIRNVDAQTAASMAVAGINRKTQLDIHSMKTETERQMDRIDALRKEGKTEEANRLESLYKSLKGLDVRSGQVTDKELQDAYEARLKDLIGKQKDKFIEQYPTWKHFADAQRSASGQISTAPSTFESTVQPPQAAIDYLKNNPRLAADFDAKYGAGASARYLGTR